MVDSKNFVKQPLVFTLGDDEPAVQTPASPPPAAAVPPAAAQVREETAAMLAGWEQKLEQLRQSKVRRDEPPLQVEDVFNSAEVWAPAPNNRDRKVAPAVDWDQWAAEVDARESRESREVREAQVHLSPLKPVSAAPVEEAALPDPIQRERAYRAYLQQWQHQHALEQAQQQSLLGDTAVLIQEDWLAAQECLQVADGDEAAACVVRLGAEPQADAVLPPEDADAVPEAGDEAAADDETAAETAAPAEAVTHVHMHVAPPQAGQGRLVSCISEAELLQRLQEKLRPHLTDAVSGMVKVVIQKQTAQLVTQLQQQLLAEVPDLVDEVLQHNLHQAMEQVKTQLRNR